MNIREIDLPGIGRKFQMITRSGDKFVVIVHDDGRRECYHFEHEDPETSISMISLDDDEARMIASIIGGMAYKPKMLENIEVAIDDLVIEWYKIESSYACVGKTIGELNIRANTGATVIAILGPNHVKHVNPGPDFRLAADTTIIVAGERAQHKELKKILLQGSP